MTEANLALHWETARKTEAAGPYNSPQRDAHFVSYTKSPDTASFIASMGLPPPVAEGFLGIAEEFIAAAAAHTFPKELVAKPYLDRFFKEAGEMSKYCCEMSAYSLLVPEYWTLAHPNAQIDNAFYWRAESGEMECGLLDWGATNHGSIPIVIGNGWMGAEPEVMAEHEERLVQVFLDEYEKVTGVRFDFDDLIMHIKLAQASVLFGCCANVGTLLRIIKRGDWKDVKDRYDPKINENFLVRCYYVQVELFLGMWKSRSPYRYFQQWMKRTKLPPK